MIKKLGIPKEVKKDEGRRITNASRPG